MNMARKLSEDLSFGEKSWLRSCGPNVGALKPLKSKTFATARVGFSALTLLEKKLNCRKKNYNPLNFKDLIESGKLAADVN